MANIWREIFGIIGDALRLGFRGPALMKDGTVDSKLNVRAGNGVGDATVNVAKTEVKTIDLIAADGKKTALTMKDGAAADLTLILPETDGNNGDTLATDGAGNTFWSSSGGAADKTTYDYDLTFNSGGTFNLVNMVAGTQVSEIVVDVTTAFDGTAPTLAIGIAGTINKFVADTKVDLKSVGTYKIDVEILQAVAAQMIATYGADSSTAGVARIITTTSKPQ